MGLIYEIRCKSCEYEKEVWIGVGMSYSPQNIMDFDSKYSILPRVIHSKKTVDHMRKLIEEDDADILGRYGHDLYRCPKCGEFHVKFYIALDYPDGGFEPDYRCGKCKISLERVADDFLGEYDCEEDQENLLEGLPCPHCGKKSLYMICGGFWD